MGNGTSPGLFSLRRETGRVKSGQGQTCRARQTAKTSPRISARITKSRLWGARSIDLIYRLSDLNASPTNLGRYLTGTAPRFRTASW